MDKKTFKRLYDLTVKELKLNPKEFRIGAGGLLLMLELRSETGDMDAEVDETTFDKIVKKRNLTPQYLSDGVVLAPLSSMVDIHPVDNIDEGIWVEGVWCATPENTLKLKESLNRPKDQDDIVKLKNLINNQ